MNCKAQIRWIIIAVLLAVIAGLFMYPEFTRKILGTLFSYTRPITGYATGAIEKVIQNATNFTNY